MELILRQIRPETASVTSLIFKKPKGFDFKPGQFMHFTFPVNSCDERCNSRLFSLASSPTEDFLMITTRFGPSALKKTVRQIKEGTTIKAIGPMGKFILEESNLSILMLAGGIGITPLRSIIKYIIDKKIKRAVTLFYSNKSEEKIVYRQELEQWNQSLANIKIIYTITAPKQATGKWMGKTGRIDKNMVKAYISNIKNTQFYICGLPKMVEDIVNLLKNLGVTQDYIHAERFLGY